MAPPATPNKDVDIRELYKRTEHIARENALTAQRIVLHETQCIEKHERVLQDLQEHKEEFRTHRKQSNWLLISLLLLCLSIFLTVILKQ